MQTVLIVEDDHQTRKLVSSLIESIGYQAMSIDSARDAVAQIPDLQPDLVIMDVRLPGMDGREATRILKGDDRTRHIPILIVAVPLSPEDQALALEAGCDEFITKPFSVRDLTDAIRRHIDRG